jgi:hypothetical protein
MAQSIDEQIWINSQQWFTASASDKILYHNANVALQAQKDAENKTATTYNSSSGMYTTAAVSNPVPTKVDTPYTQPVTSYPVQATTGSTSQVSTTVGKTDVQKRTEEAAAFTGWDNNATLRGMQVKDWDLYIASGRWDSPEQIKIHNDAEALRKSINITYTGSANGTANKAAADALILPDNQPVLSGVTGAITGAIKGLITSVSGTTADGSSGMLPLILGGGGIILLMSLFKK